MYGANGTIGEKTDVVPREAVIVFDLVGDTQEEASGMARAAYHVALHWPVKEWQAGSITTFAHPYSAPVVDRGQVFRFTLNHQLVIDDGERGRIFRITVHEVGRPMSVDLDNATPALHPDPQQGRRSVHADARPVLRRRDTHGGPSRRPACSRPSASASCTASTRRRCRSSTSPTSTR